MTKSEENNKTNKEMANKKINKKNTEEKELKGIYNFLVNATNQANLTNARNISPAQINAVFVLVSPYYIEKFNLEGFDINISVNEMGNIFINDEEFATFEIEPGVKLFGISKGE